MIPTQDVARAVVTERLCEWRTEGGVYLEVGHHKDGIPIDYFLRDPAIPLPTGWDARTLARKTQLVLRYGTGEEFGTKPIKDIVRWIGAENYPWLHDFIEEARYFGISLKLPRNFDFSGITSDSRLLLIHPRAICLPWWRYPSLYPCRNIKPDVSFHHEHKEDGPCIYQLRHLIAPSVGVEYPDEANPEPKRYRRKKGSIDYVYHPYPPSGGGWYSNEPIDPDLFTEFTIKEAMHNPSLRPRVDQLIGDRIYMPGIFGVFMPTAITQIRLANGTFDQSLQDRMGQSDLPTFTDNA